MSTLANLVDSTLKHQHDDQPREEANHVSESQSSSNMHFQPPHRSPAPSTPSARTGPPRSLSIAYSPRRSSSIMSHDRDARKQDEVDDDPRAKLFRTGSEFRGAFPGGWVDTTKKGKNTEVASESEGTWNPLKWFGRTDYFNESPIEDQRQELDKIEENGHVEKNGRPEGTTDKNIDATSPAERQASGSIPKSRSPAHVLRSRSLPHLKSDGSRTQTPRWGRLRSMLPHLASHARAVPEPSVVASPEINIADELMAGGLSTLMLKLWLERDEKGHRRVPFLFHRLRLRVSDSLHPLSGRKAVFRIECEYANGAARWVVYRTLRDFFSLHTHYRVSNAFNRNVDALPEFPRTSLPYFRFLKKQGRERGNQVGRTDFARLQRESLEDYLLKLIRAVMMHPASNRLAGFLEISAMSINLAQSGGSQYKGGYLRIDIANNKSASFGKKSAKWRERKESRWCAVRDSYLVALVEPGELAVWDVFLFDSEFKIERPKRYYRQGLNMFHHPDIIDDVGISIGPDGKIEVQHDHERSKSETGQGTIGTLRLYASKLLHIGEHDRQAADDLGGKHPDKDTHSTPEVARRTSSVSSSTNASTMSTRPETPMLDPSTNINPMNEGQDAGDDDDDDQDKIIKGNKKRRPTKDVSKHTFYIENSQMRLKMLAHNERQMKQWIAALEKAAAACHWVGKNRFDSFAPIRLNVAAQWLVDGRDYFWNLSRAMLLARETIYIHDWWLSPELYMRRPGKPHYRLDKLLKKKAEQGVKIYVIVYQEVSNRTTPTDSNYTKQRLIGLHDNIMVQRSPSHFATGTFYWAHHEKLCVIDETVAFMGGIDLCFGRWDTPQHVITDDPEPTGAEGSEKIWPGKDYSNPRVLDFFQLDKPDDDMYDRSKVPRMPWHDVGLQVVGQPARDLARHFVQRWNYLLRIKNHTREMPFLLPPPEFKPSDLTAQELTGTCEMQICRSAGPWSLGTPYKIEHSIQNAYLKAIQLSDHFVYIENQFFITSTVINEVKVENKIGDAIVHRIIRAHRDGTPWKCCVVLPLVPGFAFPVDHSDASALRIIMECQNRTICRGPNSIFARLRKEGIDPDEYFSVFALRNWSKFPGDVLTTEQVYIHGKVCIVDDRLAIIGSANINERSQRGDRDSELVAVIRDTDMIEGTMAGKPYQVGRFAHTLRVRLMREHLGVDVDSMYEEDLMANDPVKQEDEMEAWDPDQEQEHGKESGVTRVGKSKRRTPASGIIHDAVDAAEQALHAETETYAKDTGIALRKTGFKTKGADATGGDKALEDERQTYARYGGKEPGFTSAIIPTLEEKMVMEHRPSQFHSEEKGEDRGKDKGGDRSADRGKDDGGDEGGNTGEGDNAGNGKSECMPIEDGLPSKDAQTSANSEGADVQVTVGSDIRVADGSRELFGAPANARTNLTTDDQPPRAPCAKEDADDEEQQAPEARRILRKNLASRNGSKPWTLPTPTPKVDPRGFEDPISDKFWKDVWVGCAVHNTEIYRKVFHAVPDDLVTTWKQYKEFVMHHERLNRPVKGEDSAAPLARVPSESRDEDAPGQKSIIDHDDQHNELTIENETQNPNPSTAPPNPHTSPPQGTGPSGEDPKVRKPARADEPFEKWEREEMEELLGDLCGHLVIYPTRFLEGEDMANNFLFNADRLLPMPIYD